MRLVKPVACLFYIGLCNSRRMIPPSQKSLEAGVYSVKHWKQFRKWTRSAQLDFQAPAALDAVVVKGKWSRFQSPTHFLPHSTLLYGKTQSMRLRAAPDVSILIIISCIFAVRYYHLSIDFISKLGRGMIRRLQLILL